MKQQTLTLIKKKPVENVVVAHWKCLLKVLFERRCLFTELNSCFKNERKRSKKSSNGLYSVASLVVKSATAFQHWTMLL